MRKEAVNGEEESVESMQSHADASLTYICAIEIHALIYSRVHGCQVAMEGGIDEVLLRDIHDLIPSHPR